MDATRIDVTAHVKSYLEGFRAAFQMATEMLEEELGKGEAEEATDKPFEVHLDDLYISGLKVGPQTDYELAARIKRLRAKNLI